MRCPQSSDAQQQGDVSPAGSTSARSSCRRSQPCYPNPRLDGVVIGMATASQKQVMRTANGRFRPGVSGNATGNVHRSRHAHNSDTIREMHAAFRRGGRAAIDKVMKQQPAVFLKLLVLLVPRDMRVEHSGGVKAMTDEQIEATIEAIQAMLAQRAAGAGAKVIEGSA